MNILPDTVLCSLVACNRFAFRRFKPLFYCLKHLLLLQYGTFDGFDHQHFWKYRHYWAQFYHYDMQWEYYECTPPEVWKHHLYTQWCKNNPDPNDYFETSEDDDDMRIIRSNDAMVRCVSEHRHILERWRVESTTRRAVVLHKPIDEFFYRSFKTDRHPEIVKHSPNFFLYAALCEGQMIRVGDEKPEHGDNPFAELKRLTRWMRAEQGALYAELKSKFRKERSRVP